MRPFAQARSLEALNALARGRDVRTESGHAVSFVSAASNENYELRIDRTGEVATRADNAHDWFNALAWLAFPHTKARINAMHAAAIPGEGGRRGRLRDMLSIFDEGGALVVSSDARLIELVGAHRWKELFWDHRERVRAAMRFLVLGHAVLEQALQPRPGITCKAIFARADEDPDARAAAWLAARGPQTSPQELAPLPVLGYPGWMPGNDGPEFYEDARYFRPGGKIQGKAG